MLLPQRPDKKRKFEVGGLYMAATTTKKKKSNLILAKKMRDYSEEPIFKKKAEEAKSFVKTHGLPNDFTKKKK